MITIALLNSSMSWSQSRDDAHISSMGVAALPIDSLVVVPISAIKKANAKMVELEYEKKKNEHYREMVFNDSLVIASYRRRLEEEDRKHILQINKVKKERNIAYGASAAFLIVSILSLVK